MPKKKIANPFKRAKLTKKAKLAIREKMRDFRSGKLTTKNGNAVTSKIQAIAVAVNS